MPNNTGRHKSIRNHGTIDFDGLSESEIANLRERGLIQEGVPIQHISRRPIFMDSFISTPKFTNLYLALEPGINGNAIRVFHYLCYVLEYDNWIDISTVWVAEKMGLKRQQVSKALSTLEKKGLLIRGEKIGNHYKWRLNPEAAWMGRATTRWEAVEDIPYSDFIEKRLEYGDEHGFKLGYLRGLRPLEGGLSKLGMSAETIKANEEAERAAYRDYTNRQRAYNRELRSKLYGEEYADGVEWKELSEAEEARLHIRSAKVELEMKESGEWQELHNKYFPPEEKPKAEVIDISEKAKRHKKTQELVDKIKSGEIDLDALDEFIKKSGTR
ncbi:MarR family transcriptional regulator [Crocosphaera sp. Alani8]|uniref:MarR family transcriptional regulator n=1 Tax=Crocosphaera sp. Alani8 TaxID=3038952 RepID=UPI00313DE5B5